LNLLCSRACVIETRPAHLWSSLQDCRAWLLRNSSELVPSDCRLRSTISSSDLPCHNRFSASARIEVYSHLATSKLSTSSPQCRRTSPVAFSSTASSVHHARPSCTQLGRGLSSPNENTVTRCTPPSCTSSLGTSLPCTVTPSPSSVAGSALTPVLPRHFRARPNCVRAVVARLHRRSRGSKPRTSPSFDPGCPHRFAQKPFTAASCAARVLQLLPRSPFQYLLTPPARRPFTPLAPRC
jgi:hypothetical protein